MSIIILIIIVPIVESIAAYGNLTVRLVLEFDFTLILLGLCLEDVVPPSNLIERLVKLVLLVLTCLLYTSPSPRDGLLSRMPSSA